MVGEGDRVVVEIVVGRMVAEVGVRVESVVACVGGEVVTLFLIALALNFFGMKSS